MKLASTVGLLLSLGFAQAEADVLTFSGGTVCNGAANSICGDGVGIDADYGDIAGQLDVQYTTYNGAAIASTNLLVWNDLYNELDQVAYASFSGGMAEIFLKPLNGATVTLNGFDLGAWPDTTRNSQVTILDGAFNVLFSSGPTSIGTLPANLSTHFAFDLSSDDGIRIQWGPDAYNVGIDNIDFTLSSTPVPLPAAAWLMAPVVAGLGLLRRRRA